MTTRAKLNTASLCASTMLFLNVFSRPLGIPEAWQWVLMIGVFIPLGLTFMYIRRLKLERTDSLGGPGPTGIPPQRYVRIRRNLFIGWACGVGVGLAAPIWLPITGTTLGARGDLAVGAVTAIVASTIFALRLRKLPNKSPETNALTEQ